MRVCGLGLKVPFTNFRAATPESGDGGAGLDYVLVKGFNQSHHNKKTISFTINPYCRNIN